VEIRDDVFGRPGCLLRDVAALRNELIVNGKVLRHERPFDVGDLAQVE
jgi:hypothetical protein